MKKTVIFLVVFCATASMAKVKASVIFECGAWPDMYDLVYRSGSLFGHPVSMGFGATPEEYLPVEATAQKVDGFCRIELKEPHRTRVFEFKLSKGVGGLQYVPEGASEMSAEDKACRVTEPYGETLGKCEIPKSEMVVRSPREDDDGRRPSAKKSSGSLK
jgi:hypothetical protein